MTNNQSSRYQKGTDELEDSYINLHDIEELADEKTYVLRWTIRHYRTLAFRTHYNAHHVRIGKTLHRLRLSKCDTKFRTLPDDIKLIYVYLGLTPSPTPAKVSMSILTADGVEMQQLSSTSICFTNLMNRKCYSGFIEPQEFLSRTYNPTILCRVTVQKDVEVSIEKPNSMSTDLGHLLNDGMFSDITINVGSKTFHAHAAILASRSPVFEAMLRSDMKEKERKTLNIVDFDPEVFGHLLWYLYTGKTRLISLATAVTLLHLADKYDVKGLKSEMEEFLRSSLSASEVLNILVAADMCSVKSLKKEVLQFIALNLKEVMRSKEWKTFRSNVDLVDEILIYISSRTIDN